MALTPLVASLYNAVFFKSDINTVPMMAYYSIYILIFYDAHIQIENSDSPICNHQNHGNHNHPVRNLNPDPIPIPTQKHPIHDGDDAHHEPMLGHAGIMPIRQ